MNVEHVQLLLVLFHALDLMSKKAVILNVCSALQSLGEHVNANKLGIFRLTYDFSSVQLVKTVKRLN